MNKQNIEPKLKTEGAARYGSAYWCITVPKSISGNGRIYLNADSVCVDENGNLIALGGFREHYGDAPKHNGRQVVLSVAAGKWTTFFAASFIDGTPVAAAHWDGETIERE